MHQAADSRTRTRLPVASASRRSVLVLGSVGPFSSRAMVDWLVSFRAASSACDKLAHRRAERFGGYLEFRSQHIIPGGWSWRHGARIIATP
jgi:hypothetical protein